MENAEVTTEEDTDRAVFNDLIARLRERCKLLWSVPGKDGKCIGHAVDIADLVQAVDCLEEAGRLADKSTALTDALRSASRVSRAVNLDGFDYRWDRVWPFDRDDSDSRLLRALVEHLSFGDGTDPGTPEEAADTFAEYTTPENWPRWRAAVKAARDTFLEAAYRTPPAGEVRQGSQLIVTNEGRYLAPLSEEVITLPLVIDDTQTFPDVPADPPSMVRSSLAYRLLVAFNGAPPGWANTEKAWTEYPNEHVRDAWLRVEAEARRFIAEEDIR